MTRRQFLGRLTAGLFAGSALAYDLSEQSPRRANVIIFYTDDQGSVDLGCYGSDDLQTPNIDRLARQGVRFTQFYAGSSVCSPSRAALLTGRTPHRAGLPSNAESRPGLFGREKSLPDAQLTIAEWFKEHGYRTGHFGKWHLGTEPGPNGQGFEESFGFLGGCIDKFSHYSYGGNSWGEPPKWHDLCHNGEEVYESGIHMGDLIVRESNRFIRQHQNEPFFLYAAFGTPHYPLQPYDRFLQTFAHLPEPRRSYAALMATVDAQIGEIVDQVDALGLRQQTLIIFQSDQGHSTEARANYGGGSAGPYRGAKASLFEGGIRIPAIASMPGTLPENEVRAQFCTGSDWFPTAVDLCGLPHPAVDIDGTSILDVLNSSAAEDPHTSWHWQLGEQWAVRDGKWKLLMNARDTSDGHNRNKTLPGPFLVNLDTDPGEQMNLAKKHPDIVSDLMDLHQTWVKAREQN